jgi:hypothetical protein
VQSKIQRIRVVAFPFGPKSWAQLHCNGLCRSVCCPRKRLLSTVEHCMSLWHPANPRMRAADHQQTHAEAVPWTRPETNLRRWRKTHPVGEARLARGAGHLKIAQLYWDLDKFFLMCMWRLNILPCSLDKPCWTNLDCPMFKHLGEWHVIFLRRLGISWNGEVMLLWM